MLVFSFLYKLSCYLLVDQVKLDTVFILDDFGKTLSN